MTLYSVKYETINQKTRKPSGTSGTIISASTTAKARYIFKCSHVDNTKIKYKIISVEKEIVERKSAGRQTRFLAKNTKKKPTKKGKPINKRKPTKKGKPTNKRKPTNKKKPTKKGKPIKKGKPTNKRKPTKKGKNTKKKKNTKRN